VKGKNGKYDFAIKRKTDNVLQILLQICEKYQSRDEKFPEPNGGGVFAKNTSLETK
jgi:hypothetical protein